MNLPAYFLVVIIPFKHSQYLREKKEWKGAIKFSYYKLFPRKLTVSTEFHVTIGIMLARHEPKAN
jgi:hypothetical protein